MFVESSSIKVKTNINLEDETINITVSAEKKFEKTENIIEEIRTIGGNIKEGDIFIDIKIMMRDFMLDLNSAPVVKGESPGIKVIYFKLVKNKNSKDKNSANSETKNQSLPKKK